MVQKKAQSIGIFDSGIGGFSILKKIHQLAPHLEVYYIADRFFAPYGNKSDSEVIERSSFITDELMKFNVDLVVVACNTATGSAIDDLRTKFDIPFVGVEPFINALSKSELNDSDKGCVITTDLMSKSSRFKSLISRLDPKNKLSYKVTAGLAPMIESFFVSKNENSLRLGLEEELFFVKEEGYTHLILGCTHYPLIGKYIEEVTGAKTLSPCPFVANRVFSILGEPKLDGQESRSTFKFGETTSSGTLRFVSKDFSSLP